MRLIITIAALILTSCNRLALNTSDMTTDQMLRASTHLFIGVIEKHEIQNKYLFRVSGEDSEHWRVIDMRVHVENVLRGAETRPVIDIYEVFPTGVLMGDWNDTQNGRRYLFPVRLENGRYHVVRDHWRSIFPVYSGRHARLPLDDSRPFWER